MSPTSSPPPQATGLVITAMIPAATTWISRRPSGTGHPLGSPVDRMLVERRRGLTGRRQESEKAAPSPQTGRSPGRSATSLRAKADRRREKGKGRLTRIGRVSSPAAPLSTSLPGCGRRFARQREFSPALRAFLAEQNSRVTRSLNLPAIFLAANEAARCRFAATIGERMNHDTGRQYYQCL